MIRYHFGFHFDVQKNKGNHNQEKLVTLTGYHGCGVAKSVDILVDKVRFSFSKTVVVVGADFSTRLTLAAQETQDDETKIVP